jgi:thioredoxin 1
MMDLLTGAYRKTGVFLAALPLAGAFAGCMPAATSWVGQADPGAANAITDQDSQSRVAGSQTPGQSTGRVTPERTPRPPSPVALASANRTQDNHWLRRMPQPKEKQAMMTTKPKSWTHGKVGHVATESFQQHVLKSNVPVLVDFYADWCGPCRRLAPVLDQLARETPHAKVVKVNIDTSPQLAQQYGVSSIPTVMVFKGGSIVAQHTGLADRRTLQRLLAR